MKAYKFIAIFVGQAFAASSSDLETPGTLKGTTANAASELQLSGQATQVIRDDAKAAYHDYNPRSVKRQITTTPAIVYRVDTLSPKQVRAQGGFPPRQSSLAEREFLATGGIRWDQVISSTRLRNGRDTPGKDRVVRRNKDYNAIYNELRAGGPQYQLAGFPKGHEAWTKERWSPYLEADISESGLRFADESGKAVGLSRDSPLQFDITYKVGKASAFYRPSPKKNKDLPPSKGKGQENSVLCRRSGQTSQDCDDRREEEVAEEEPPAGAKQIEAARRAESVSDKEFVELATKYELSRVPWEWQAEGIKSLSDVRTKLLAYRPIEPTSPRLRPGNGGAIMKVVGEAGEALWVTSVVHAFVTNSTALGRAAAITAIIPFVGCAVNTAAEVEEREDSAIITIDSALCFIGDALILGGLVPLGFVFHLARIIIQAFTPPPEPPTKEELLKVRDELWNHFLHEHVFRYIYSHSYNDPKQEFAFKLNNTLAITSRSVVSEAAQTIGALNASSEIHESYMDSEPGLDPVKLETGSREAIGKIRDSLAAEILRKQREVILGIPTALHEGEALSLRETGEAFNTKFITRLTSRETVEAYSPLKWKQFFLEGLLMLGPGPGDAFLTPRIEEYPYQHARAHLVRAGEYLKAVPVMMPRILDTAFVIGQSKGLADIHRRLLSGRDYIKQEAKRLGGFDLPDTSVDVFAILQAIDVAKVLQGRLKEENITRVFPVENDEACRGLQLLLAMKCGRLYEDAKLEAAERERRRNPWILSTEPPEGLVNPLIPPIPRDPDGFLVSLMLGIIDTVLDVEYDESANGPLRDELDRIQTRLTKLREMVQDTVALASFGQKESNHRAPQLV
ncbi:Heat-labile enterotoxin, A chain [Metarhizium album ARSEF 1941]|uniref:Heat-labile enterotoxin, A chain n=1 Tax=Metarhizium album (strain ARSEF 1941) TaxID=1081103 RepID=A0A0B2WM64_METAS|nr:Heat-labile enterotoxin, A chain [Metarhizium album ARSEF 1941]KHN94110.1 Heat-labile enterotoxin, A chain [Metarhizium album ARSEF 1941]